MASVVQDSLFPLTEITPVAPNNLVVAPIPDFTYVTTAEQLRAALGELARWPVIGLDIETTGLRSRQDRIRLCQLATPEHVYLIDCFALDVRALQPILGQKVLVGHNLKFDLSFLARAGIELPPGERLYDTYLTHLLIYAGRRQHQAGLDDVVARELGYYLDKALQTSSWERELTQDQLTYAARDAALLLPLKEQFDALLHSARLESVHRLEMRALPALIWLEQSGAPFSPERWRALAQQAQAEVEAARAALDRHSGRQDLFGFGTVNWSSAAQVKAVFAELGYDLEDTEERTIKELAAQEPLAQELLRYKNAIKRATTYGEEFLDHLDPVTGRIHSDYRQLGAVSGRMSSAKPNLQNIPRDPAYRACFVAPEGRVLCKADYSQIELRIAGAYAKDPVILEAYRNGEDLHTKTAALILDKPIEAVTKDDRQIAKSLNFGLLYGMGAEQLQSYAKHNYGVSLTLEEATAFRNRFFEVYRGLKRWHQSIPAHTVATRTRSGRRRLHVEKFTEKANMPVQGTAADGMKAALGLLFERRHLLPNAFPVLTVHDELVIECPASEAAAARAWLIGAMVEGMATFLTEVPVEVEAELARDWGLTEPLPAPDRRQGA